MRRMLLLLLLLVLSCANLPSARGATVRGTVTKAADDQFELRTEAGETISLSSKNLLFGKDKIATGAQLEVIYDDDRGVATAVRFNPDAKPVTGKATLPPAGVPAGQWLIDDLADRTFLAVVTGVGRNAESAKLNAYQAAVEQTIGVLVDAETLIKDGELIHDDVLTYSEGDVESFDTISETMEGGLVHVRAKVVVRVEEIAKRLQKQRIHVLPIDARKFFDVAKKVPQDAAKRAKAFKRFVLSDYGLDKMLQPVLLGDYQVVGNDAHFARVKVEVGVRQDLERWNAFRQQMESWILATGGRRSLRSFHETERHRETHFWSMKMEPDTYVRVKDIGGTWILLATGSVGDRRDPRKAQINWQAYQTSPVVQDVLNELHIKDYRLRVMLIDAKGRVLAESSRRMEWDEQNPLYPLHRDSQPKVPMDLYFLGPYAWAWHTHLTSGFKDEFKIDVALEDLKQVKGAAVLIEERRP